MTVYLVTSLPKILHIYTIYMALADPTAAVFTMCMRSSAILQCHQVFFFCSAIMILCLSPQMKCCIGSILYFCLYLFSHCVQLLEAIQLLKRCGSIHMQFALHRRCQCWKPWWSLLMSGAGGYRQKCLPIDSSLSMRKRSSLLEQNVWGVLA
jgi:hypothetical protein